MLGAGYPGQASIQGPSPHSGTQRLRGAMRLALPVPQPPHTCGQHVVHLSQRPTLSYTVRRAAGDNEGEYQSCMWSFEVIQVREPLSYSTCWDSDRRKSRISSAVSLALSVTRPSRPP